MTITKINKYELFLIFSNKLDQNSFEKTVKDVEAIIAKYKGLVLSTNLKGKKRLAYRIASHNESLQAIMEIETEPASIEAIQKQLNIHPDLIRFGIFNLELV
jgi:small subunit ribosomal protein S6